MAQSKKPQPPKIPRCLCSNLFLWILQIPSPSKCTHFYYSGSDPVANEYFDAVDRFHVELIEWKIANRTCTRKEWHYYRKWRFRDGTQM